MTKDNLTPTSIVDKNGKRTTVHKKTASTSGPSAKLTAAKPRVVPTALNIDRLSDDPESMEGYLKQLIRDLPKSRQPSNKRLGVMLDGLHPDTLSTLAAIRRDWSRGGLTVEQSLKQALSVGNIAQVNNLAFFYHKDICLEYDRWEFHAYVQGMQEFYGVGFDATLAPESDQTSMRAFLVAALNLPNGYVQRFENGKETWRSFGSLPLGTLIMECPDDVDRIVKIINDRPDMKFHNVDEIRVLRELLDQNVTTALSDGVI